MKNVEITYGIKTNAKWPVKQWLYALVIFSVYRFIRVLIGSGITNFHPKMIL